MKTRIFYAPSRPSTRLCAAPLALALVLPAWSQTQLKQVVVTASRFAEPAATLPFGVSVVTAEEIQASGAGTVNEALMKLLGVVGRLDTSGGNNYSLDLRGFGSTSESNQVVIVDGLRLNEADLTSAGLSSIPIASVHRIEVLRGSGAVLYGEGATGGVIVVTTKAGIGAQRVNAAQVYAAGGNMGQRETRATATVAAGGFSADVAASDRSSDGHRQNFASASNALSASVQWSNAWLRVGARAGRDAMHSGLPGALTAAQYASDPRQANSLTDYGATQNSHSGVFAEAALANWRIAFDANKRAKDYESVNGFAFAYAVDAENYSLRARHEGELGQMPNALVLGLDRGRWDRTAVPVGTRASARSSAWYVKDDITLPQTGTRLSVGWRTEKVDKSEAGSLTAVDERQHAWEVGASQPLGAGFTAYGRVGRSFRLANVDEFSFTVPAVFLKPQTSRDLELGARWKSGQSAVEARWYRSMLRNEIGYDPAAPGPFALFGFPGANVNFDPTRRRGLELDALHSVTPNLDLRVNAAWRQARFTAGPYAGNDVMLVPKRTLALRADWRPAAGHTLGAGVNWVSSQSPDFANMCSIPGYSTADLRYAYQWGAAELALGISNLADRKFTTQAFGCAGPGVATSIYPEAGRSVTASLRLKF